MKNWIRFVKHLWNIDRLVKRNDAAIDATIINGRIAYEKETEFVESLGKQRHFGEFLSSDFVVGSKLTETA